MGERIVGINGSACIAAINFMTKNGRYTLRVERWLNVDPSDGSYEICPQICHRIPGKRDVFYGYAKKGITGIVVEIGEYFIIHDDYDFANPGLRGKRYHVNAQVSRDKVAFCVNRRSTEEEYYQRINWTGQRYYFDGSRWVVIWYTSSY